MNSGVTKYIVCVSEEKLECSQKIKQSMKFRQKPAIVRLEWFIDSLEACQIQPLDAQYIVDTSPLYTQSSRSNVR